MKKILVTMTVTIFLFSCEGWLDVPLQSSISTQDFYKTQSDFELSLVGAYDPIANHQDGSGIGSYFRAFMNVGRAGTDEMYATSVYTRNREFSNYTFTASNQYVEGIWQWQYIGISRANTIIDRLPQSLDEGLEISPSDYDRILGEAYFLRGFYYFQLVRWYGGVPLVTEEVLDYSKLSQKRASLADTYAQVVADFKKAEELLPIENQNGRARKFAAKAFLAKVYLQMSGVPLNDQSAANEALNYTTDVINNGGFALLANYEDCFNYTNEYHSEYIFDAEYTYCGNCEGGQVGTWSGPPGEFIYTQAYNLVRVFHECYESFDPADLRREWNIANYRIIDELGTRELVDDSTYFAYKWRHGLTKEDRPPGMFEWQSPFNFPLIRYADVLLMHAEAVWRAAGKPASINDASALEAINQVRRRGYGLPVNTPDPSVDLVSITEQALLDERKWELCFEGHRWHDLVRFGKLVEAVKSIDYTYIAELPRPDLNIKDHHIVLPIPQTQIDVSEGELEQNVGY